MTAHPPTRDRFGVVYFTDDNPAFRRMLDLSLESLRRFHPDWPVKTLRLPSPRVGPVRRFYRLVSVWKRHLRDARCNQDMRTVAAKAEIIFRSPFESTLYLDVDTVVTRPLDVIRARVLEHDVVVTPMPWKRYERLEAWQPENWPYVMAGVFGYSRRLLDTYRGYIEKIGGAARIAALPTAEQFVLSLICSEEASDLDIDFVPELQLDVLNAAQHLGSEPRLLDDAIIDISDPALKRFHIFHYNEHKPAYLEQIRNVWGVGADA